MVSDDSRVPGDGRPWILIVEDGHEYHEAFTRFLGGEFRFMRVGNGHEALSALPGDFKLVFLDMCFDRVPDEALLGDVNALASSMNADWDRARRFVQENQGAFILAELRRHGCRLPVVMSHDFQDEPRRWRNLERLRRPLYFLPDNASPEEIQALLARLAGRA